MSTEENQKPSINPSANGPYLVKNLKNFSNQHGPIETKTTMALCRCGGSKNKPFCNGTHWHIKFTDDKN